MNFEQYAPLAIRTASPMDRDAQIEHAQIGLVTEVGELADAIKRNFAYGKELDITNFVEEVGDVFWYAALLATELGIKLRVIDRLIEDTAEEDSGIVSLTQQIRTLAAMTGALAAYKELEENPQQLLSIVISGLVHLLKRFDRTVAEALVANIEKLHNKEKGRYKDGVFSAEAALNRNVDVERETLNENIGA